MVYGEEEVTGKCAAKVRAISKIIPGKGTHEGILIISQFLVKIRVRKIVTGMTIHSIQEHSNASLVRCIDQSLQILPFTKSLIHTK